jgi:hypothetical protein
LSSIGASSASLISSSISRIWLGSIINSWGASTGASTKTRFWSLKFYIFIKEKI